MKRLAVEFGKKRINISLPSLGLLTATIKVCDVAPFVGAGEVIVELVGHNVVDNTESNWGTFELVPGDSVNITVHDDQLSDPPNSCRPRREMTERQKRRRLKASVRSGAAKLGWTIIENDDEPGPQDTGR